MSGRVAPTELEEMNRLKSEFVSTASHELRSPLTGLLGALERLQAQLRGSGAETRALLEGAAAQARQLVRLADQLLDLSRLEAGRADLAIEPLQVGPLVVDVVARYASQAADRGVSLDREVPDGPAGGARRPTAG